MRPGILGILLYGILLLPPIIGLLEGQMILHMLVQLPLLIFSGWLCGAAILRRMPNYRAKWNGNGIPGILVIVFITTYWMLPRAMDESLVFWQVELFKFIGLPFAGLCLRDSWPKIKLVGKSFLFLNYLSMFALMAWLYIDAPVQICNNYAAQEQQLLGWGFLFITATMIIYLVQMVFTDQSEST
ncbi:hypothetical protein DX933_08530 [Ornithinibacillus gellani]|uniref:hypothetical protein n=1 Tax=Ornithinibacillus gellani TaxID=2293253 RepID=UPI000F47AE9C|nr:hypothetical protein [Ornithinibacillus gellani]TQS74811.1 hypothetical protein DX933_08530 [Ornithinibacillus gellani]